MNIELSFYELWNRDVKNVHIDERFLGTSHENAQTGGLLVSYDTDIYLIDRYSRRLRGLAVACWITDHYLPHSNLGVGIPVGCFIFDFASLPFVGTLTKFDN